MLACMLIVESVVVIIVTGLAFSLMVLSIMACELYENDSNNTGNEAQPRRNQDNEPHYLYFYETG